MTRFRWVLRRPVALLCLASAIGAIAGAAAHPLRADSFRSETAVAVLSGPSGALALRDPTRAVADVVKRPEIAKAVSRRSGLAIDPEDVRDRVEVIDIGSRSGLVRLRGSGRSQSEADMLVDAVAEEAVFFMRRTSKPAPEQERLQTAFTFDIDSLEGWLPSSPFSYAVRRISVAGGEGRGGTGAMGFQCTVARAGCGPGVKLAGPISTGRSYIGQAFARTSSGTAGVRLVLGSGGNDVAVGTTVRLDDDRYRRLKVAWVPARGTKTATLALQTTTDTVATIRLDSVVLTEKPDRSAREKAGGRSGDRLRASSSRGGRTGDRFVKLAPSAAAPATESRTWRWALLAGLGGLVVCAAGLGTASLARKGGNQAERDPNA